MRSTRVPMGELLLIAAVTVFSLSSSANATPETACKAAANIDKRVEFNYCLSSLLAQRDSNETDPWGLAQTFARIGASNARDVVVTHIKQRPTTGEKPRSVLGQCSGLYDRVATSFIVAYDNIKMRRYAAGKKKAAEAVRFVHQCDEALRKAGASGLLQMESEDSVQLAIICTAFTNLIK